jgi:3-methyl-2-oxobutanoate hydroxymethyltransferase
MSNRLTISALAKLAREGRPFACLTCYDASTSRLLTRAGVHVLLVGDTAAEMVLGFSRTIDAPLDFMIQITAGVRRGSESAVPGGPGAVVMADMPFMSYQAGQDEAIRNAGRFLTEGQADVVKVEVDAGFAPLVERMTRAGVPICAHIGSRPQRAAMTGGYASAGRSEDAIRALVGDAAAMRDAGCSMMLIEAVPEAATQAVLEVTRPAGIPLIGIGAGPACDGQVLVWHDWAGLTDRAPSFAPRGAEIGAAVEAAGRRWVDLVAARGVGASPFSVRG